MLVLQAPRFDFGFEIWPIGEFRTGYSFCRMTRFRRRKAVLDSGPPQRLVSLVVSRRAPTDRRRPCCATDLAPADWIVRRGHCLSVDGRANAFTFVRVIGRHFIRPLYSKCLSRPGYLEFYWCARVHVTIIWLFALFCKDRRRNGYLAGSFLAWFVALGTYTIQIGAMGGIFFSHCGSGFQPLRRQCHCGRRVQFSSLCHDLAFYVMIWFATSPWECRPSFHLQFSLDALAESVAF